MRVIVCGGRQYWDRRKVFHTLDSIPEIEIVIHGAASGADTLAGEWAKSRGVPCLPVPADWVGTGKRSAGPARNRAMTY